jgi:Lytic transglycolase
MKRRRALPDARVAGAAVGASMIALPATAAAVGDAPSIQAHVHARVIHFAHNAVVTGSAPGLSGHTLGLEFVRAGTTTWHQIASGRVASSGSFRLAAPLARSGALKVIDTSPAAAATTWPLAGTATAPTPAASSAARISVTAAFRVRSRERNALGGGAVNVVGRLVPGTPGRRVALQVWHGGHWATVARARTGGRGGFDLRYRPGGVGRQAARVRFGGDATNGATAGRAGVITAYRQSLASWYDDAGTTGCGFHAYYGVANVSLPCGTKVRFAYGGRRVTATVDDRGPYVGGREWDLNQNTAAALGFGGAGSVWSSS